MLYSEVQIAYIFSDHENPTNHPIYVVQEDIGSCILHLNYQLSGSMLVENTFLDQHSRKDKDATQRMHFDGSLSKPRRWCRNCFGFLV